MSAAAEIERFAKDSLKNDALRTEIKSFGTDQEAIIRMANSKGYDFSLNDVTELSESGEMTDDQLSSVAGGILAYSDGTTTVSLTSRVIVYKSGKNTFIW